MEHSSRDDSRYLHKKILKTMPIWSYFDKFRADLETTQHDVKRYCNSVNEREKRIAELPELGSTDGPRSNGEARNNLDIVRIYRKVNQQYERYHGEKKMKENELNRKAAKGSFRTESVKMLERKFEENEEVYAMVEKHKPWIRCRIRRVYRQVLKKDGAKGFITKFRLKPSGDAQSQLIDVNKYMIARIQDHRDNLRAVKRVIAGPSQSCMLPGIIAEQPDDTNKYRYLVFLDNGSARYFKHNQVLPILGQSNYPWEDAEKTGHNNPVNIGYMRHYFASYPKKHILQAKIGEQLGLFRNGVFVSADLIGIDCNTIRVLYKDNTEESIYRGSPRLLKDQHTTAKLIANVKNINNFHINITMHLWLYKQAGDQAVDEGDLYSLSEGLQNNLTVSINHNTARKSTISRDSGPKRVKVDLDGQRVDEDREIVDLLEDDEQKSHKCTKECLEVNVTEDKRTEASVNDIIGEFRDVSDLKVPILLGWKRKLKKIQTKANSKKKIVVTYEAPCGKIYQTLYSIRLYLGRTGSKLDIDYFSFDRDVILNVQNGNVNAFYYEEDIAIDFKTRQPLENKNVSLLNQYNEERLPQDFEYRNESFPHPMLEKRNFSFNHEFKSGCDCEDDCSTRAACSCHILNERSAKETDYQKGTVDSKVQYNHKRLLFPVNTGIFECNSFCKCSSKCSNRVVQNGIRFRLQVQKTINKGWGVVTLDDIPKGAFICTYAAELLDDADMYGDSDMYFADLDYITENERTKSEFIENDDDEGVEVEDAHEKKSKNPDESDDSRAVSPRADDDDDNSSLESDNYCGQSSKYLPKEPTHASRYPKRKVQQNRPLLEFPSNERPKFKSIHKLLDSHDYTLDARMQGNVGRFFNHSCDPNSFVQNVFIKTHDLRFPVVAFFASRTIKALSEINWNYNYKVNSIPGRRIDCHCGASNCQGRIL